MLFKIIMPFLALGALAHPVAAQDQLPDFDSFRATNSVLLALKFTPLENAFSGDHQILPDSKPALGGGAMFTSLFDKPFVSGESPVSAKVRIERVMSAVDLAMLEQQPEQLPPVVLANIVVRSGATVVVYEVPAFDEYIVQRGDTLIRIATDRYDDPALISRILLANFDDIYNPDVITAGQLLILPRQ